MGIATIATIRMIVCAIIHGDVWRVQAFLERVKMFAVLRRHEEVAEERVKIVSAVDSRAVVEREKTA